MAPHKNILMGQRFLARPKFLDLLIDSAELIKSDTVLEVGAGDGRLTERLACAAKKVIAVEKDGRFVKLLKDKFSRQKNIEIIEGDILKLNIPRLEKIEYKIVANIPYYITSRFLKKFLDESENKPERMVLMIQREVGERIVARPPGMNLLALSVQAFGTPRIVARVPRSSFRPAPKVNSAIISIMGISEKFFSEHKIAKQDFFAAAKKAFSQKRKMLKNSLNTDSTKRPQELSLIMWGALALAVKKRGAAVTRTDK